MPAPTLSPFLHLLSKTTFNQADIAVACVLLIPLLCLWLGAVVDIVLRHDLRIVARLAWILVIVLLPFIGTAFYLVPRFRPRTEDANLEPANGALPRRLSAARSIRVPPAAPGARPAREAARRVRH